MKTKQLKKLLAKLIRGIKEWKFAHQAMTYFTKNLKRIDRRWLLIISGSVIGLVLVFSLLAPVVTKWGNTPRDLKLKKAASSTNYLYTASNKDLDIFVGEKKSNLPTITLKNKENSLVSFTLSQTNSNLDEPIKEGNVVTFPNIRQGVDLKYQTLPNGIKEEIILTQQGQGNSFAFDTEIHKANPKMITNEFFGAIFYDQDDNYLFHFEKPYAIDSAGNRTDDVVLNVRRQAQDGNLYKIIVTAPLEWLNDPARVYPIIIDPTVIHDTSGEFSPGQFNRNKDMGAGSLPSIETYYQELPTDQNTVGLWHMNETTNDTCSGGQDACDLSGNGNHGTATGTTIDTSTQRLGAAARSFNGTSDYVQNTSISPTITGDLTVEGWFKTNTTPGAANRFIELPQAATLGLQIYMHTAGQIGLDNSGGPTSGYQTTEGYKDGNWHHVAVTRLGTTYTLYVDGILKGTSGGTSPTYTKILLGKRSDSTSYWAGTIDEVRISNIARTPEEIKMAASRRPYSTYTSDVIDLTSVVTWNSFTWTELGVNTGDGETLKDSTSLVAQWNFNETSGTTADNAEGTAGLDGTLTGFASTASQDQAAGTGWTANNRRWGAGALMFDGSSDYVSVGSEATFDFTDKVSMETWFNSSSTSSRKLISKSDGSNNGYELDMNGWTSGNLECGYFTSAGNYRYEGTPFTKGKWQHAVCVIDTTQSAAADKVKLFLDGIEITSPTVNTAGTISTIGLNNFNVTIGTRSGASPVYFNGIIDAPRIYSRALAAAEIMSNYQAGNIEFQTRVGADTSPDDGSWEAWKPTTGETAIESYDGPYQYNTTDSGLVSYWPMDETADNSCSGGEDACDRKTTNHGTATGTKIVDGKYGKGRSFNGTSDLISLGMSSFPTGTNPVTVEAWFNLKSGYSGRPSIAGYGGNGSNDFLSFFLGIQITTPKLTIRCNGADFNGTRTISYNEWHHAVAVDDGTNMKLYLDGVLDTNAARCTTTKTATIARIGRWVDAESDWFKGEIDEVRIYSSELSAATIQQHYLEGSTRPETLHPTTDSTYKLEGSASQKIETGRPTIDGSTVGLWHLDETGGTGAYLKDSTTNANNGAPTGTTVVNGVSGKGRSFNGSSDYINAGTASWATIPTNFTISSWIKVNSDSTYRYFFAKDSSSTYNTTNPHIIFGLSSGNRLAIRAGGGGAELNAGNGAGVNSGSYSLNTWIHVAATKSGSTFKFYLNGVLSDTQTAAVSGAIGNAFFIGKNTANHYWNNSIDEVKISDTAASDEEIAEAYRSGRDHYINKTISSTDLSAKTSLPFYVAADRPGSYLSATIGESAFANYQPDSTTRGLWHLDEQSGSGAYVKDASGLGNHLTPTGTTFGQGKFGKARSFNGSSDLLTCTDANCGGTSKLDPISTNGWSYGAWVNPSSFPGTAPVIMVKTGSNSGPTLMVNTSGQIRAEMGNSACNNDSGLGYQASSTITTNKWSYVVVTVSAANPGVVKIYINGQLTYTSAASAYYCDQAGNFYLGANGSAGYYWSGLIDEAFVNATTLSDSQVRQAYEVGLRTHPITIDFGAKLDSGNLITGSGDLGFTVDATYYGLQNKGDMLFKGDKVIVRENYDGTEYIAQGTVDSITASTGATTVSAWDSGSTFPSGGYTVNASVFKWQREYWNINNETLDAHTNAITNLSLRLTDGAEGRTIWLDDLRSNSNYLTTPEGSTITSSTGNRYFQYRAILSSFDEAVSATLSAVTVDYSSNGPPNTPSLDLPINTATNQILSPVLKTTTTDSESDYVRYKIELCTNVGMTTGCQTFDQTVSQTGWSGQNAQTSTAYTSGTQATYTIQTPLVVSTTYYWRSYAIDPGGSNTWSGTQTPYSFITTTAPTAPTTPYAEGTTNPSGVTDITPEFSAVHNDPNGDSANYYQIEVNTAVGFDGTVMWDSGKTSMTTTANGIRSPNISYAGSALSWATTYYWRIKFWDTLGSQGTISATQNFSMNYAPNTPSLDSPADAVGSVSIVPALKTTSTDTDADYLHYKIEFCENAAMTLNCQTFNQTSSQVGWSGQDAQSGTAYASGTQATYTIQTPLDTVTNYYWRSYAIDPAGANTWSATQSPAYSFTTTNAPTMATNCRIREAIDDSSNTIIWTDVAGDEDYYRVERSEDGGGWTVVANGLAAGTTSYQDSTITANHTYNYRVAPYFTGPVYGTWCSTDTLTQNLGIFSIN